MIAGIPGIRTAGSSQKGEKGEFGPKGRTEIKLFDDKLNLSFNSGERGIQGSKGERGDRGLSGTKGERVNFLFHSPI